MGFALPNIRKYEKKIVMNWENDDVFDYNFGLKRIYTQQAKIC